MLEFDDIQHILLTRAPALTGRYEFLSFRKPSGGRAWLAAIQDKVLSAGAMKASVDQERRWVTVAFTWNGLRAPGLDERVIVLCDHGESSSLAAATLVELGFSRAGDVVGGFAAWVAAGLPVVPAAPAPPGLPGMTPPAA